MPNTRQTTNPRRAARARSGKIECSGDFEATTDENDCRVWLWGLLPYGAPDEELRHGNSIDGFMYVLTEHNRRVSFHNLRYDGGFIIDWLFRNGFEYVTTRGLEANQFKALISDQGKFYSITIRWDNGVTTEFVDSLKKLNMSVSRVATTFKLAETKGEIDYHLERHADWVPTDEEIDYLRRDVGIMAQAMTIVHQNGLTKLTTASDALAEYKSVIGDKTFARLFPTLAYETDAEIRKAYRGGFTYADPRFMLKLTRSGLVLDVNSLYPSVMYNMPLPYGIPQWQDGMPELTERFQLSIFSVTFTAKIKPDHIPCIQIKGSSMFHPAEYLREITDPTTMVVTNVDWQLYNDHYDIDVIAFEGGFRFRAAVGMFKAYIDKWSEVKANTEGGERETAKLLLNALYGKFGTNPNVTGKNPYFEDNRVKYQIGEPERRPPVYTAVAVFTTSYGRDLTIRAAQDNYDVFAYADTDSLHLLTDEVPNTLDVHPSRMGAWKREYGFTEAFYVRPKAYLEHKPDGTWVNRFAGVPEKISEHLRPDDIFDGHVLNGEFVRTRTGNPKAQGKLTQKVVPGGVVLHEVPYEIKL